MKRIIFYADVIIAICLAVGFAAIFWLLSARIMTKIFEADFPVFVTLLSLFLYVLLFSIMTIFIVFAAGFSIHRANIQYKKHTRSFTILRPDAAEGRKESAFSPAPHFAGDFSGSVYFVPGPGMLFANYGSAAPFDRERSRSPFTGQGKSFSHGKSPAGNKPHLTLVKGGRASPGDPPQDSHRAPSPAPCAGRGNNIRQFPRAQTKRRK
jgi:hypothetical protein